MCRGIVTRAVRIDALSVQRSVTRARIRFLIAAAHGLEVLTAHARARRTRCLSVCRAAERASLVRAVLIGRTSVAGASAARRTRIDSVARAYAVHVHALAVHRRVARTGIRFAITAAHGRVDVVTRRGPRLTRRSRISRTAQSPLRVGAILVEAAGPIAQLAAAGLPRAVQTRAPAARAGSRVHASAGATAPNACAAASPIGYRISAAHGAAGATDKQQHRTNQTHHHADHARDRSKLSAMKNVEKHAYVRAQTWHNVRQPRRSDHVTASVRLRPLASVPVGNCEMKISKLFQVLVVTGASSTVGLAACSSSDDSSGSGGSPSSGTAGATSNGSAGAPASGTAGAPASGTAGAPASGTAGTTSSAGAPATGGGGGGAGTGGAPASGGGGTISTGGSGTAGSGTAGASGGSAGGADMCAAECGPSECGNGFIDCGGCCCWITAPSMGICQHDVGCPAGTPCCVGRGM